jgi:FHA domain
MKTLSPIATSARTVPLFIQASLSTLASMGDTPGVSDLVLRVVEPAHATDREFPLSGEPAQIESTRALVHHTGEAAMVEDHGSEDGVFVNEQPIHGPSVIRPGDQIRIGLTVYELSTAGEVSRTPTPSIPEVPEHEAPAFLVEETAPAYVQVAADEAGETPTPLLKAWRDTHVKRQTHIAAFAVLALAGLAVGFWLGFH